ncbi:MAG: DUF4367 domain-containing protein [Oscillospiraceae bacterium]|jgi:hypothetical protein|nr:DUF4367 domain-containing protein [Oscillospiraceae bacterium]
MNIKNTAVAEAILKAAIIENHERALENLQNDKSAINISALLDKKIHRLFSRERYRSAAHRMWRVVRRPIAAIITVFAAISILFLTNSSIRAAAKDVLIKWTSRFASFSDYDSERTAQNTEWRPTKIPDDFVLTNAVYAVGVTALAYEYTSEEYIAFDAYPIGSGQTNIDNEDVEYSVISRNGVDYHIFEILPPDKGTVIFWQAKEYDFVLSATLDKDELLKVALSVKKISEK